LQEGAAELPAVPFDSIIAPARERNGMTMRKLLGLGIALAVLAAIMMVPVGGGTMTPGSSAPRVQAMDLSAFPATPPKAGLRLLFIHHSCGGHLFADSGERSGENCIYTTHPNGGGLRGLLVAQGYEVHEASYGSAIGEKTDIFDWPPKFAGMMEEILACDGQDKAYAGGQRNDIVAFKSCYPNSDFTGLGAPPGNPAGPELTVWNAKAAYAALLPEFAKHPGVLFVCLTAPPIVAGKLPPEPLWKSLARAVLKREREKPATSGPLAREFNNWLVAADGWLKDYSGKNVVVFDYYDILTAEGRSDYAEFPTGGGGNSHPSAEGNAKAARAFVPFLNQAARRAGF